MESCIKQKRKISPGVPGWGEAGLNNGTSFMAYNHNYNFSMATT